MLLCLRLALLIEFNEFLKIRMKKILWVVHLSTICVPRYVISRHSLAFPNWEWSKLTGITLWIRTKWRINLFTGVFKGITSSFHYLLGVNKEHSWFHSHTIFEVYQFCSPWHFYHTVWVVFHLMLSDTSIVFLICERDLEHINNLLVLGLILI